MKAIGNKSNEPLSKNTSLQDRKKGEGHIADDMWIVEALVINKVDSL